MVDGIDVVFEDDIVVFVMLMINFCDVLLLFNGLIFEGMVMFFVVDLGSIVLNGMEVIIGDYFFVDLSNDFVIGDLFVMDDGFCNCFNICFVDGGVFDGMDFNIVVLNFVVLNVLGFSLVMGFVDFFIVNVYDEVGNLVM